MNFQHDVSNQDQANQKAESNFGNFMARLLSRVTGPMPILGGQGLPSVEGKPGKKVYGVNEDPELLEKTEHVRGRGEKVMELMARCPAVGAHFIRTHSKAEIKNLVDVCNENRDEVAAAMFAPKKIPTRFLLTD